MHPQSADAYTFVWGAVTCLRKALYALAENSDANAISYLRNAREAIDWAVGVLQRKAVRDECVSENRA